MEEMPDSISKDRCVLGQGVGLLSATAISTFSSIASFLPIALSFVRLAFRIGSAVDQTTARLSVDIDGVWSKKYSSAGEDDLQRLIQSYAQKSVRLRDSLKDT